MVAPINKNTTIPSGSDSAKAPTTDLRIDGVSGALSPASNIPNDEQNYHWFSPDISGSRTVITATMNGNHRISANISVNDIVTHILNHVGFD